MIKCPRCHIEQEKTDICKFCDFEMSNITVSHSATLSHRKTAGIVVLLFFIAIISGIHYFRNPKGANHIPEPSPVPGLLNQMTNSMDMQGLEGLDTFVKNISSDGGFSTGGIISALIFSLIGMAYFSYGKKTDQYIILFTGVLLMCYPYFIQDVIMLTAVGIELCCMPFVMSLILE